jgi:hypothetical protein
MNWAERAARFKPDTTQIGYLSWPVGMLLWLTVQRYTHWDIRVTVVAAVLPIWVAQGLLFKTPPKKWAIQVVASLAFCLVAWKLLNLVWR